METQQPYFLFLFTNPQNLLGSYSDLGFLFNYIYTTFCCFSSYVLHFKFGFDIHYFFFTNCKNLSFDKYFFLSDFFLLHLISWLSQIICWINSLVVVSVSRRSRKKMSDLMDHFRHEKLHLRWTISVTERVVSSRRHSVLRTINQCLVTASPPHHFRLNSNFLNSPSILSIYKSRSLKSSPLP